MGIVASLAIATLMMCGASNIYAENYARGVSNICNPVYHSEKEGFSEYNYVYFGKTGTNSGIYSKLNNPILFRVLNVKANTTNNTNALLLLSEYDTYKEDTRWNIKTKYTRTKKRNRSRKSGCNFTRIRRWRVYINDSE